MQKLSVTPRKRVLFILLFAFSCAVAGVSAGVVFGRAFPEQFPDAPVWLLPAIVIGAVALLVVAALTLPTAFRARRLR